MTREPQPSFDFINTALPVLSPSSVVLNADGISVKGCSAIYAPKGEAEEYSALACNPYIGCGHCCRYNEVRQKGQTYRSCYVTLVTRQPVPEFNAGAVLKPRFIELLGKDAAKYKAAGITEQVNLSFSTDAYHPGDTSPTRTVLEILIEAGLGVSILTKGGTRALRDLDLLRPDRDCFGTTLTFLDDRMSRRWEPKAALPGDRFEALKAFFMAGIFTWVSLEPIIDVEQTLALILATHRFVDLYKIGRWNYDESQQINWAEATLRIIDLLNKLGKRHYIKQSLQRYLPPAYYNPMRVAQHHGGGAP
jgi:hypothetical protein